MECLILDEIKSVAFHSRIKLIRLKLGSVFVQIPETWPVCDLSSISRSLRVTEMGVRGDFDETMKPYGGSAKSSVSFQTKQLSRLSLMKYLTFGQRLGIVH